MLFSDICICFTLNRVSRDDVNASRICHLIRIAMVSMPDKQKSTKGYAPIYFVAPICLESLLANWMDLYQTWFDFIWYQLCQSLLNRFRDFDSVWSYYMPLSIGLSPWTQCWLCLTLSTPVHRNNGFIDCLVDTREDHGLYGSTSCCISQLPKKWERESFDQSQRQNHWTDFNKTWYNI